MFVIMKPSLIECVEAVLALNLWNYRMTLVLMVGQTCLGQGLEGAAKVVAVQSCLRVDESLLAMMLPLIFTTLLIVSASILRCSTLHWMVVRQEPRSWACSLLVPVRLHCFRSLATTSFHRRFCPPAECLSPTGAHTRSCLGNWSSSILERCPRK